MKKICAMLCMFVLMFSAVSLTGCGKDSKHKVNFYVDGQVYAVVESNGNEKIELEETPSKTGYLFAGWFLDENFTQEFTSATFETTEITSDVNVYSKWTAVTFKVTYNANNGTKEKFEKGYDSEDEIIAPNIGEYKKEGFVFAGWNTRSNGSGTFYHVGDKIVLEKFEDTFLFAVWYAVSEISVNFVGDYVQSNYQVFAVEVNKTRQLSISATPSVFMKDGNFTGNVTYKIVDSSTPQNLSRFTFEDGKITVTSASFEPIEIEAIFAGKAFKCAVVLKAEE